MLKGQLELPFTVFITIMALLGIFFAGVLFLKSVGDSASVTANTISFVNTVDAIHFTRYCLEDGKGYISATDLDAMSGTIGEICASKFPTLSEIGAGAKIIDLELIENDVEKTWVFGYMEGSNYPYHQIHVNILVGDEIHIGRLYVQTEI